MRAANPKGHTREIIRQGWPTLVAQMAVMLNGVIDTVMAGRMRAVDLAAVGLGSSIYITVNVGLVGVLMALMPEIARHHGAGDREGIGRDFRQGLWLALALAVPGVVLLLWQGLWQSFGDPGPQVSALLHEYLWWIMLALPANLLMRVCFCLNMGIGRPKVMMHINLAMLAGKLPLNALLMFGIGDWAGLGAPGSAAATAVLAWLGLMAHAATLQMGQAWRPLRLFAGPWAPHWRRIGALLKLGIPTAGGYLLEVTAFTFMALWLARMGAVVTASHQIASNLTALLYMTGLAIANATTNLTARELGAGQPLAARAYAMSGLRLAALCAVLAGALVALLNQYIARLYTDDPAIAPAAAQLILLVAVYHFFDVGQTMCSYVLRAYRVVTPTVVIFFVCLWIIGLGLGYSLTFGQALDPVMPQAWRSVMQQTPFGFWSAALLGVVLATLALFALLMRVLREHGTAPSPATTLRR